MFNNERWYKNSKRKPCQSHQVFYPLQLTYSWEKITLQNTRSPPMLLECWLGCIIFWHDREVLNVSPYRQESSFGFDELSLALKCVFFLIEFSLCELLFVDDWVVHVIFIYLLYLYWTRKIDLFTSHLSVLVWIEQRAFFINTFPK